MRFSAKTLGISIGIALLAGFLIGFIPQHMSRVSMAQAKDRESAQLGRAQEQLALTGFKNRIAMVYVEAEKKNFAQASSLASSLFTAMQSYSEQTSDSRVQQDLSALLNQRDAIIAGLAKGDEATTGQLQQVFLKMQSLKPSTSSGL